MRFGTENSPDSSNKKMRLLSSHDNLGILVPTPDSEKNITKNLKSNISCKSVKGTGSRRMEENEIKFAEFSTFF